MTRHCRRTHIHAIALPGILAAVYLRKPTMPQYQYSPTYSPASKSFHTSLIHAAAEPYRTADWYAYWFARIKSRVDPAFATILKTGLIADGSHLLDLGCGQGLLASWLIAAQKMAAHEAWPQDWALPPALGSIRGIDLIPRDIERAQRSLGQHGEFSLGDIAKAEYGKADAIVILDVLHYMDYTSQERVLQKARQALLPNGRLILRVSDASGGIWFKASYFYDQLICFLKTGKKEALYCRSLDQWQTLLKTHGFRVETIPLNSGLKLANNLLLATPAPKEH